MKVKRRRREGMREEKKDELHVSENVNTLRCHE
jgi:hypothetical protein